MKSVCFYHEININNGVRRYCTDAYNVSCKKRDSTFAIITLKILMDFNMETGMNALCKSAVMLIDDAVDQWPTRLRACVRANGRHFEHTF